MIWAIGDVQGCYDPLSRLLEKIEFTEGRDRLLFVGDLVNRGKKSREVISLLHSIRDSVDIVLGNHDIGLLASSWGIKKINKTIAPLLEDPRADRWLEWIRGFEFLHIDREHGVVMSHAGISPLFDLDEAKRWNDTLVRRLTSEGAKEWLTEMMNRDEKRLSYTEENAERYALSSFIRMRYCYADGSLDFTHNGSPESLSDTSDIMPWFEVARKKELDYRIVFGHWSTLGYREMEKIVALDSGCLWRGRLTARRIDSDIVEFVQVECPEGERPY
jgi:bis(5'-nucleosyl)-tetraphosphatase (symmetrical)